MNNVILPKEIAKQHLAVNLWAKLEARAKDEPAALNYKWLADKLSAKLDTTIHVSRIQKILEQTSSPDWSFIVTIAGVLGCKVEDFGKEPSERALERYAERFPEVAEKLLQSA